MSRVLIILGMHRSGTSITTKWLNACGLDVGTDLLGPQHSNKRGHFEDMDFYNFHEKVFNELGIPFGGFVNLEKAGLTEGHRETLNSIIEKKNGQFEQWGWKDPRTCLFLDHYLELIPNARILFLSRDFNAIINSLIKREIGHVKKDIIMEARWGYLSYLSYYFKEGRKEQQKLGELFSKACIHYYKILVRAMDQISPGKWLAVQLKDLPDQQERILEFLSKEGFHLKSTPFESVYESSLMTSDGKCPFIPKRLRSELSQLQDEINRRCIH